MNVTTIDHLKWTDIAHQLDIEGYAVLPGFMALEQAHKLTQQPETLRHVSLASADLGRGDLFFFGAQLPTPMQNWRTAFYRHLAPIANRWNETLNVAYRYPGEHDEFLRRNREAGQSRPLSHLSRLNEADYLALHQRDEGEHLFPLQVVALLSKPGEDFRGGEFVMTEQRPRMQSRPMVLPLQAGDAAIISTAQRPFKGAKGFYRVNLKHAVSRVRSGTRFGLELSFHDAP
jgi:hypothetical protein